MIAAALLCASILLCTSILFCASIRPTLADPLEGPPATTPGVGVAQPPGAPIPGESQPVAPTPSDPPAQPKPSEETGKAPDFSLEGLGEATQRFWAKVFDPKSFESQPFDPALTRPPGTVVRDQRACPSSAGLPDCASAAKLACTAQGFANGRPLDTASKRTCPPEVMIGLRKSEPGECRLDYVVSSSICW
jgi:hypothetical protein